MFWLAYGADPTPLAAQRGAVRMFQAGDLSSASTLLEMLAEKNAYGISPLSVGRWSPRSHCSGKACRFRRAPIETAGSNAAPSGTLFQAPYPFRSPDIACARRHCSKVFPLSAYGRYASPSRDFRGTGRTCWLQDGTCPRSLTLGSVIYRHAPLPERAARGAALETATDILARLFREHAIETVQAASNNLNALPALMAARSIGATFVYEVRGFWELTAAARIPGWEETERYRFDRELEIRIATEADHVLAVTQGIADELIAGGVPADRISLLPNAVDPELFAPLPRDEALAARLGLRDGDFVVVYAGSLSSYEGLDDLIEAVALLCRQDVPARLVLVGDGRVSRKSGDAVGRPKRRPVVCFLPDASEPDEVRQYLSLADAVAIPRKPHRVCQIVSPLKPFEAMAMEKPVILTDLPALREIVDHGRTGLICRAADPSRLGRHACWSWRAIRSFGRISAALPDSG